MKKSVTYTPWGGQQKMKQIPVKDLKPDSYCSDDLYLDEEYILLPPEVPVSSELINRLVRWGFLTVWSNGSLSDNPPGGILPVEEGEGGTGQEAPSLVVDAAEQKTLQAVREFFSDLVTFCEKTYSAFLNNQRLNPGTVADKAKEVITAVRLHQPFIFRIQEMDDPRRNYLIVHSAKTAILAAGLGLRLQIPQFKLVDLVTAALLHEIGMIRLPPQLYLSNRVLTPEEKRAITAHPVIAYKTLRSFGFPIPVCLAVLEHHEHMDGSGYPRGLKGDQISVAARIMGICSTYAALTAERPYRPPAEGHTSLLDMMKRAGKWYDEMLLRSLIFMLSLYPIGSYVMLQSGAKGLVVESNPENPRCPVVKILFDDRGHRLKDPILVRTDEGINTIRRALTQKEVEELLG
ncbi:HD-GYP domain-containing protein [Spirochaeta thermophila]|nr:HD-GYP domain-containing protein [Spirochaeta thermophila]